MQYVAGEPLNGLAHGRMVGGHDVDEFLGVEPVDEVRRADKVGEQHRHLPPLAERWGLRGRGCLGRAAGGAEVGCGGKRGAAAPAAIAQCTGTRSGRSEKPSVETWAFDTANISSMS